MGGEQAYSAVSSNAWGSVCGGDGGGERLRASSDTENNTGKFVFHTAPLSGVKYISWEKKTFLRAIPREHAFLLRVIYVEAAGGTLQFLGDPVGWTREGREQPAPPPQTLRKPESLALCPHVCPDRQGDPDTSAPQEDTRPSEGVLRRQRAL